MAPTFRSSGFFTLYLTTRLGVAPAIIGILEGIAESLASLLKSLLGLYFRRIYQHNCWADSSFFGDETGGLFVKEG